MVAFAARDFEGMTGYDIIGDVHGCATHLTDLLDVLGYQVNDRTGSYAHPNSINRSSIK